MFEAEIPANPPIRTVVLGWRVDSGAGVECGQWCWGGVQEPTPTASPTDVAVVQCRAPIINVRPNALYIDTSLFNNDRKS